MTKCINILKRSNQPNQTQRESFKMKEFIKSVLIEHKLPAVKVERLAQLVINTYFPNKKQLHKEDTTFVSHTCEYLKDLTGQKFEGKQYHRGCIIAINERFNLFTINNSYKKGSHTRGYKVAPWLASLITDFLETTYIDTDLGQAVLTFDGKDIAIARLDDLGKRRKTTCQIKRAVRINREMVRALYNRTTRADTRSEIIRRQCLNILVLSDGSVLPNSWLPSTYEEKKSGRLYGQGCHLQNVCREVRHEALKGMYELDMSNAHYSFLAEAAAGAGQSLRAIEFYLNNKKVVRNTLTSDLQMDTAAVKTALISLIYGATTKTPFMGNEQTALRNLCGSDHQWRELVNHDLFKAIAKDVKTGGEIMTKACKIKGGNIYNCLNKPIAATEPQSKVTAHILQGLEAMALNAVVNAASDDVAVLLHDGIVWYNQPSAAYYELTIRNATGYSIKLEGKKI